MGFYDAKILFYKLLYRYFTIISDNKFYNNNILISGATRSGTTWLMEMLYAQDMKVVWEPTLYESLQDTISKQFAAELGVIPYIPKDADWPEAYNYFNALFVGKIDQAITEYSHPLLLTSPFGKSRQLIKFCNINLLLPWLCRNFDISPIVIIRNPYDVVTSQLNHNGYEHLWEKVNIFDYNKPKYDDIFLKYEQQIKSIDSKIEMLAHWWAVQHVELLENLHENNPWKIVFYEDLLRDTELVMSKLIVEYNINKKIADIDFFKPSSTRVEKRNVGLDESFIKDVTDKVLDQYGISLNTLK